MDPTTWDRIESIYLAAVERLAAERPAFLDEACAGDPSLRREVDALLEQHETDPEFMETPIVRLSEISTPEEAGDSQEGRYIGSYRLVRLLGRGGMGEVYLAIRETEDVRQPVALKVIRRGMDTDEVLKRFSLERRILASLHHPNIAHLLDASATEDGRPYFVMEHVEGLPIDDYCDHHRLAVRERVELLRTVCGAIQHAHQNLVVHRDLKPGNILVTADGLPKLLDFGIGKVLAPTPSMGTLPDTRTHVRLLTPEYASPEQLRGESVTTASDVYGLGLLLYKILSGRHPYAHEAQTYEEIERVVLTQDPERPSLAVRRNGGQNRQTDSQRLGRALAGDLDNIVLKALRKEPERRYPSAAALSEDLQRYLEGRPVAARPDTLRYRAGKFIKRHAWGVAAAAVVFIALGASTVVTLVQSQRVAAERDNALTERDKAVEVQGFLLEMFGASAADQAVGDTTTARQLLDRQVASLAAYDDRPVIKAEMMAVLADAYERLGLYQDAEPLAREALELRRENLEQGNIDIASSLNTLGWILHQTADPQGADSLLSEAVKIRRAAGVRHRADLARSLNDLGVVSEVSGEYDKAESLYREALEIRRQLFGNDHRSVGITTSNLSTVLYRKGDVDEAIQAAEEALRTLRLALGPDHSRSFIVQSNLATFRSASGDWEMAEREYRDLLDRGTRIQGRSHPRTLSTMSYLASSLYRNGKLDEADELAREALAIQEANLGPIHGDVANTLGYLADFATARNAFDDALHYHRREASIWRELYGDKHREVGLAVKGMANIHRRMGNIEESERLHREAVAIFDAALGHDHRLSTNERVSLGRRLLQLEKPTEALSAFEEAYSAAVRGLDPGNGLIPIARLRMAEARIALGDCEVADSLLDETDEQLEAEAEPRYQNLRNGLRKQLESCGK